MRVEEGTLKNPTLWSDSADFALLPLEMIAAAVEQSLREDYAFVDVGIAPCPDLSELGSASAGLCGSARLIELGGEPYAHHTAYRDICFHMDGLAAACGLPGGHILGAGIAHRDVLGGNCGELIASAHLGNAVNRSKAARVGEDERAVLESYDSYLHGGLANFFLCEGNPGDVMHIKVKKRIGKSGSFPLNIRKGLVNLCRERGKGEQLGMGGVFEMKGGKVRSHIMPNFECIAHQYYDEEKDEVFRDFLQFYETMGPNLVNFSVLWSGDPTGGRLHLRPSHEHTHFYHKEDKQQGGHYHYDITPEEAHYEGVFYPAAGVHRINNIYVAPSLRGKMINDKKTQDK